MKSKTKVIQVSNIAPQATKDQMSSLFGYLGKIEDIRLYPTIRDVAIPVQSRMCFIKFHDRETVGVAQHLTNTVFIDRALVVIPYLNGDMPDEKTAMDILNSNGGIPGLAPDATWPPHVSNQIDGIILRTTDPRLTENCLPDYPNLPATTESYKVNEIRRTVVFDNIDPTSTPEEFLGFSERAGQVKYLRMGTELNGSKNCLVEYTEQGYIIDALKLNDVEFMGRPIKVNHSTVAIIKPQTKSNEAAQREIEEAMRRVKDAQNSIFSTTIDPLSFLDAATKDKFSISRSRSRSRSRKRSRSRSKRSHSNHRSFSRSKKRSRSRSRKSHSRSKSHSSRRNKDKHNGSSRSSRSSRSSHEKKNKEKSSSRSKESVEKKKSETPVQCEEKSEKKEVVLPDIEKEEEKVGELPPIKIVESTVEIEKESKEKSKKDKEKKSSSSRSRKTRSRSRSKSSKEKRVKRSHSRSHSHSRSRRRSKSKDRKRKHRTKSRSVHRSPSISRARKVHSRDRSRRSRSAEKSRRRSASKSRRSIRNRSRSRDRKEKRDKDKEREKKDKKKDKKEDKEKRIENNISRNYDEEDEMFNEIKKAEDDLFNEIKKAEEKEDKEETVDMDISNSP